MSKRWFFNALGIIIFGFLFSFVIKAKTLHPRSSTDVLGVCDNSIRSDINCDETVDLVDFSLWRTDYMNPPSAAPTRPETLPTSTVTKTVTPTPALAEPGKCIEDSDCGWCGDVCTLNSSESVCLDVEPPSGYDCVCNTENECEAKEDLGGTVTPVLTLPPRISPTRAAL